MVTKSFHRAAQFASIVLLALSALAQTPAVPPPPPIPSTGFAGLDQYRAARIAVFYNDYGQLGRYRGANGALLAMPAQENRVVFYGDSITDIWKLDQYFPDKPYVNRGIGGQTTPQMLVRFRQDVIELHPKVVVFLAGTNDIAGNTGPMLSEDIEANFPAWRSWRGRTAFAWFLLQYCRYTITPTIKRLFCPASDGENSRTE